VEWIVFIVVLIIVGVWTKWRNTIYMRKLAVEVKEKEKKTYIAIDWAHQDNAHDLLGVAEMGTEILGEDNPEKK